MEKIGITGVPETMIQTLYARAKESGRKHHRIYDGKAIEIVGKLDYDFSAADRDVAMQTGVIARTLLLDRMVGGYVDSHPDALIINIACGLDTRFYRVDNGRIRWVNIDLPETMDVRRRFLKEEGRVSVIACSAMDEAWASQISDAGRDVLAIIEGLTMYLTEDDVRQLLGIIAGHFPGATVYMEILSPRFVGKDVERSIKRSGASFTWGAASGEDIEKLAPGYLWQGDRSLAETMPEIMWIYKLLARIPAVRDMSNKISVLRLM